MNCKFCGNFVPEGKDSCPVCGRRPEEEPISKLLTENFAASSAAEQPPEEASGAKKKKRIKKGLTSPLVAIIVSALTYVFGLANGAMDVLKSKITPGSDSSYSYGADSDDAIVKLVVIGVAILAGILGIYGIFLLFKRLYNRIKYRER